MINLDENALICDFAETYGIYDYGSLPVKLVATLASGLRENARIRLRAANMTVSQDTLLLASICDRIELFRYGFSKDAEKGINMPKLMVDAMLNKSRNVMSFSTPEEFKKAWEGL